MQNLDWVAGAVVVSMLVLALGSVLGLAVWDLFRQYRGLAVSVTASTWIARFCVYHPIAVFCAGLAVGILAAHFGWGQVVRANIQQP